ncbi:MAG: SMP-30/gluconolactonase/LRE family protein [Hyphomicrobiales bacterium]|nr:SMP-30/gluconolactonase/LRE family protein [Hyphomicrobiales bacterium]
MSAGVYCADEASMILGESALWSPAEQAIYWVDGLAPAIYRKDMRSGLTAHWSAPDEVGCIGLRTGGGLVAALRSGFYGFDPASGLFDPICDPEADRPRSRFNDGKVDRGGRFWSGTVQESLTVGSADTNARYYDPVGRLWRLDPDLSVSRHADGITMNNGLCWSPDNRRMYFSDSFTREIVIYDFDIASGAISNRQLFARISPSRGVCDGATVDADGGFWCANIDGGCVTRYRSDGSIDRIVELPVTRPTSCCFGGPELRTLFITTARRRLSADELTRQPFAGCLLAIDTDVPGLPEPEFAG